MDADDLKSERVRDGNGGRRSPMKRGRVYNVNCPLDSSHAAAVGAKLFYAIVRCVLIAEPGPSLPAAREHCHEQPIGTFTQRLFRLE